LIIKRFGALLTPRDARSAEFRIRRREGRPSEGVRMKIRILAAAILTFMLIVPACQEETEEEPMVEVGKNVRMASPDTVSKLGISLVYAEEALWKTTCGEVIEDPEMYPDYDSLFVITNSNNPELQHPVAEIGPPRPDYDGRWRTFTVRWTDSGLFAHEIVPIIDSYSDIIAHEGLGHMVIEPGRPQGGPPEYFSCTLVPFDSAQVAQ